jgi:hypothetical protein
MAENLFSSLEKIIPGELSISAETVQHPLSPLCLLQPYPYLCHSFKTTIVIKYSP